MPNLDYLKKYEWSLKTHMPILACLLAMLIAILRVDFILIQSKHELESRNAFDSYNTVLKPETLN